ncbi:hypothetical protein Moror_2183 [Moniliophthora roreri MCA 2997]|uniref:DUF6589 domain-containing protein n=2 Tax=Moniliophthora roreri TaxID=221103 RepID=V2WLS4_MONRO|nr:hypothetical protein Moror_2183 [Moniliophthora roreri MCA 2997]
MILDQFANTKWIDKLQEEQTKAGDCDKAGDMVLENVILFMCDSLLSHEFSDAIKVGDSGHILLVLKIWALSFHGNGRTKYAYEMLHLIHNLMHVWPPSIQKVILHNWVINLKGKADSFHELDLLQEHLNFWIKVFYKAQGSNALWEWLEMISPCVEVLRQLANKMKEELRHRSQGTQHSTPDLQKNIETLMKSLKEKHVYELVEGRKLNLEESPAADAMSDGLQQLTSSTSDPLAEYNNGFSLEEFAVDTHQEPITPPRPAPSPFQQLGIHPPTPELILDIGSDISDSNEDDFDVEESATESPEDVFGKSGPEITLERNSAEDVALDMDSYDDEYVEESGNAIWEALGLSS